MNKKTIRDVDFSGKRVLIRADFNVPLDNGLITDDTRIRAAIPTIQAILKQKPRSIVLMSHLGRPDGRQPEFSLAPVASALSKLLDMPVEFAGDCIGTVAESAVNRLPEGDILLLENTRFHKEETKNNPDFALQLSQHGEIFVNDAFGTAHRAHASNVGVAKHLPAVAGLLMEKEIDYLSTAIENPQRPFTAILGGAKVSDKIPVIEALLGKVDALLIGGGMANTFFEAQEYAVGNSLAENDAVDMANDLMRQAGDKLILPVDVVIADAFENHANTRIIQISDGVPDGWQILDIGPATINQFTEHIKRSKTIVWNGPMGVFEMPNFAKGTFSIAKFLAEHSQNGATVIIGGGDSAAAAEQAGIAEAITHISTGGGASLELLEGKPLPGLTALADK